MRVIYEPLEFNIKRLNQLKKTVNKIKESKAIVTVAQFKHLLKNFDVKTKGTILGCNTSALKGFKGKTIVFIGDGVFHALNIKKNYSDKKVLILNPFNLKIKEIKNQDVKKFLFREAIANDALEHANNIGIIITTKAGQNNFVTAKKLKKIFEKLGKKVYLFLFDNVVADEFLNFKGIDVLINTACPRIGMDDYTKFPIPIINYNNIGTN